MTATSRRMHLTVSRDFVALRRTASVRAKVKREVRRRDEGKCQWPLAFGGICGARARQAYGDAHPRGSTAPYAGFGGSRAS